MDVKKERKSRKKMKRVRISGPTVCINDKVVAGDISQEFSMKDLSAEVIANVQRECVLFSGKILSLIAQNGDGETAKSEFPPFMVGQKEEPLNDDSAI